MLACINVRRDSLLVLLFLLATLALAQQESMNTKAQPKGGKAALQIIYYRIDFTQEETAYLRTHAPELIFSVTGYGVAKLEKVNDIEMRSIIDSLMRVNDRLPEFYPERVNGKAETGIYFLKLTWPNYQSQPGWTAYPPYSSLQYYSPYMRKLNEFSEINYRGPRYDMVLGGFLSGFGGNIGTNLSNGWGTKFDFMIYGNKGWGGGFGTTFILAKPLTTNPGQPASIRTRSHMISLFTGSFGKLFRESKAGQLGLQLEPAFGLTDIVDSDQLGSSSAIGLGFSPGISAVYLVPLGKGRMGRQYFMPVTYKQYLSFHFAARSLMFNNNASKGTVYEFGLSYRLASRPVATYKLKDNSN